MREDPGLELGKLARCLEADYGLRVGSLRNLPIGYDFDAAVYEVLADDGAVYFLKVRFGPVYEPGFLAPRALIEHGVPNILAPLPARSTDLWRPLDDTGYSLVLYPFVRGENAMVAGMSDAQWRVFGATLRAVHDSGLAERFRTQLRVEDFALPSAALVREILRVVEEREFKSPTAARLAAFWRARAEHLRAMLARAENLGRSLQAKRFEMVLCHGDIHTANILVGEDGSITLIDWDGPLIAPRERDLLFVIGSRIARVVEPEEEGAFFRGYGPVAIDPEALVFYRYERIVEDIGEIGKSVFLDESIGEQVRETAAALAMSFFAPGGDIERAETVERWPWSGNSV